MKRALRERIDISKISKYSIAANAMQILFAFGIFLYALFGREFNLTGRAEQVLVGAMALIVIWGAALDIRDAFNARKIARQSEMLEEAYGQLEDLNATLRAQRHDFKNHLQVVFGLIELKEYREAQEYIERVYGDVELVGRSLKTAIPAVNALFAAKMADCEEKGIQMDVQIHSPWQGMPIAGWEMCRILGNLIDNAMDAILSGKSPQKILTVEIGERLQDFTFRVENTGPEIPEDLRERISNADLPQKVPGAAWDFPLCGKFCAKTAGTFVSFPMKRGRALKGASPKILKRFKNLRYCEFRAEWR